MESRWIQIFDLPLELTSKVWQLHGHCFEKGRQNFVKHPIQRTRYIQKNVCYKQKSHKANINIKININNNRNIIINIITSIYNKICLSFKGKSALRRKRIHIIRNILRASLKSKLLKKYRYEWHKFAHNRLI